MEVCMTSIAEFSQTHTFPDIFLTTWFRFKSAEPETWKARDNPFRPSPHGLCKKKKKEPRNTRYTKRPLGEGTEPEPTGHAPLFAECASGATGRGGEASGLDKDTKEMTRNIGRIYLPIRFGRRRGHSRLPGPLRCGFSLRSGLGELGTHAGFFNKETQQIQGGNKEPPVGVTTGRAAAAAAAAAAHTPEGGGSGGGEEDRTEPIKYTPDKKF
ncbi:hypothetical protein PANDA_011848 [Ailuropoda melanoleuca]|uniref:Uncharacterized protein n=1 Tax=Ailuropoda melanoleuca TaxID=9646 RepID=D2HKE7_AILME|nr:hypothetical protein PANDA_011848 [Ailuropoda melanoleuca]